MKVVLITGASSGIGKACSVYLHHLGYRVYGTSRYAAQDGSVSAGRDGVRLLRMDLTDQASIASGIRVVVIRPGDFNTGFTANRKKLQPPAGSPHSQAYKTAPGIMEQDEENGPAPELIAMQLARLLASKSPPLYSTVGTINQRFLIALRLFMPVSIFERLIKAYYRL